MIGATGCRPGRILAPLGIALVLSLAGDLTLYAVLPAQAATLGLSLSAVGLILSANRIVRLASNPLVGLLLDRWGRRPLFLLGMGLGVLSTLSYALFRPLGLFLLARVLWGVAWSLIYVSAYGMVLDVTGPDDRGRGSGILQAFYFAGLSLNPLLGGVLAGWLGFRLGLAVCAALSALGFLIALLALPETASGRPAPTAARVDLRRTWTALGGLRRLRPAAALQWCRRQRQILTADYLCLMASIASNGIVMSTISLYLQNHYGSTMSFAGLSLQIATAGGALLAFRALVSVVVAPLAGRLSDRSGNRWLVIGWGAVAGAAGMGLLALASNPLLVPLGVGLVAVSSGALATVLPALVCDRALPERRGGALGALMAIGDAGSAVAPLAVYALLSVVSLESAYLAAALGMASGLVLAVLPAKMASGNKNLEEKRP